MRRPHIPFRKYLTYPLTIILTYCYPGTVIAHVAVHATLFGVYETVKDLGMKSLPPAAMLPITHQPLPRVLDASNTTDGGGDIDGDAGAGTAWANMTTSFPHFHYSALTQIADVVLALFPP